MPCFRNPLKLLLFCALILAASASLWAQAGGTISGTISDSTGAVVPGVEVSANNVNTGITRTTLTGDAGSYRIPNLIPGLYVVRAALTGFKTAVSEQLELSVGQTLHVELVLEVGAVTEEIMVTGAASTVEVEQARVSSLVDAKRILDLPLNGRNIFQLMQTAPGVVNVSATVSEPGQGASVNGGRVNFNGFWLDGVSSKGLSGGTNVTPNVDSVQEFRIETLNFSPEFGNSAGSIVSVVSKTGTNDFHGSVYNFHRNDNLDASEFFDEFDSTTKEKKKPEFKQNQFGFSLGGPIRRNSTFFFGSYEGLRIRTGESSVATFESSQWGSFVQRFQPKSVSGFLYKTAPGRPISTVTRTVGSYLTAQGFIDAPTQANVDAALADLFGAPAGSLKATDPMIGDTSFFTPDSTNADQFNIRIDQELGQNDKFFGRYYFDDSDGVIVDARPVFNSPFKVRAHQLAFSETHIFSPTTVNEARAGLNRGVTDILAGLPGVPSIAEGGTGTVAFGAYNGYPQIFHENVFNYSDVLSITKGRHGLKAGVEVRRNQENSEFNVGRPSYYFYDLIFLALDDPYYQVGGVDPHIVDGSNRAELASNFRGWRNTEIGVFFNDDFKLTPNLTLNLGVRWDWYSRLQDVQNRTTKFDLSKGQNIFQRVANGDFARTDQLSEDDWNNFAPRIGFAWDPGGDGKMAIRAGFGIAYQSGIYNPLANSRWNPPFYSFNLICDVCGRPRELILYGPQKGEAVSATGPNPNVGGRLFEGNIIAYEPTNNNTTFLTGIANPKMRDPYVQSWFLGFQREFIRNWTFEANYVGTAGRKLIRAENFNRFPGDRTGAPNPANGCCAGATRVDRINPKFGRLRFWENSVNSSYNALQGGIEKRFSGGFSFRSNYTFAKSLDTRSTWHSGATTANGVQEGFSTDVFNVDIDYGRSIFDARHRFTANWVWELPFFRDSGNWFTRGVLGGWQMNGIVALQSGQPFTPFVSLTFPAGGDFNADAENNDRPNTPPIGNQISSERGDWSKTNGPFKIPTSSASGVPTTAEKLNWFGRPSPAPKNGNLGRNTFEGPGFANVDFSIFKEFPVGISEGSRLQFRGEFFNLFNRVNFFQPAVRINDTRFGRTSATFDAREIQLALKLLF